MPRLAKSSRVDSWRARRVAAGADRRALIGATGLASARLTPAGCALAIPRLTGIPVEQQLWEGAQASARVARSFLEADIADVGDWVAANRNLSAFLKATLERWLLAHGEPMIREQFCLDVLLSTTLDRYLAGESKSDELSRMFIALEPDSAGYVVLGPTVHLLESIHPKLPSTFLNLFLGALNRWIRVYDQRDALDRVERLRDWYETDPEGGEIELPDIDRCLPKSVKRRPLGLRALAAMVPKIEDPVARQLLGLAIETDHVSRRHQRPVIDDATWELLIDCGEPVPALLAVFEQHDPIEGCFDEDCQTMLEVTPAPNLIIPFNGETSGGVLNAFAILETVFETLSLASRLITILPGNERLNDTGANA
jgi:hypothetical protein